MKLRSKLLLSATCLLTISVAATATSAYAWFVSNRQATVAINNANVKTNATNLKIAGVTQATGDTASFDTTAVSGALNPVTSAVTITDISGNGKDFYKPELPAVAVASNEAVSSAVGVTPAIFKFVALVLTVALLIATVACLLEINQA